MLVIGSYDLTVASTEVDVGYGSRTPGDVVLLLADIQTSYVSQVVYMWPESGGNSWKQLPGVTKE